MDLEEIKRYKMLFLTYLAVIDVIYPSIASNEQTRVITDSLNLYRDVATDVITYLIGLEQELTPNETRPQD